MEQFSVKNQKALRCGYTTGSCAAAAAAAAAQLLLTGSAPAVVRLPTPKGVTLLLEIERAQLHADRAVCAVRKDSGDDPDVTDGIRIYATASRIPSGIEIDGGQGVGHVTRPGLSCSAGEAAINPVPREQIRQAVENTVKENSCQHGIRIEISAENGEEIAKKTFNSRLGIIGGISILGTSGIVEPMSEQALIDTIRVEMDSRWAAGEREILACPGNYGRDFARETLHIDLEQAITTSNYLGETLDYAIYKGFAGVLLIGHAGKLIKLAAGVMQTHSSYADGRQEIFAAHAAMHGADPALARALMNAITVDECLDLLDAAGLTSSVLASIGLKIEEHLEKRTRGALRTEFILFTNAHGELLRSAGATAALKRFEEKEE